MKALLIFTTVLCSLLLLQVAAAKKSQEDRLVSDLLEQLKPAYRIARPVSDAKDNVTVTLGLVLIRVASVQDGSAELDAWLKMIWKDPRLAWQAEDYGGVTSVALPADLLWLPDIRLYSSMGYKSDKDTAGRVVIQQDSTVIYVLPVRLRTHQCETLRNQSVSCQMKLGSWVYNEMQLDLNLSESDAADLSEFVANKWNVVRADAKRQSKLYPCCPESFVSVQYTFMLNPNRKEAGGEGQ